MEDLQTKENKQQKRLMKAVDHALRGVETALKGMVREDGCGKPDMKALKDATAILKELMGMIRELYGISAPRQEEDRTIQVVFAAGDDSWNE